MGKHRRKSNPNFQAQKVTKSLALSTLADGAVITGVITGNIVQDSYAISTDLVWSLSGATQGEGPITVGLASGDLSVTEIVEAIDANPVSQSDRIARERASRPVRIVGTFPVDAPQGGETLENGMKIRTKVRMSLANSADLVFWARNHSGSALTTGALIKIFGNLYIRWT